MQFRVTESLEKKEMSSENFHAVFNKQTCMMAIWGKTPEEDPCYCPFGPLVAYVELSDTTSDMFKLIMEQLCMTKTLCLVVLCCGEDTPKNFESYQKVGEEYGVKVITNADVPSYEDGALYSLFIDKDGVIFPQAQDKGIGIPIQTVENMVKDVWYSDIFKTVRYQELLA